MGLLDSLKGDPEIYKTKGSCLGAKGCNLLMGK